MVKPTTFGFSAFLKMASQNEKPQTNAIRKRLRPSRRGGYDFHKRMRTYAQQMMVSGCGLKEIEKLIDNISREDERKAAKAALATLETWRASTSGAVWDAVGVTYTSPKGIFRINYTWDFCVEIDGRKTAIHLWNTKATLSQDVVLACLTLLPTLYEGNLKAPEDFAVLSLRSQEPRLYRWSESTVAHKRLSTELVSHIEMKFEMLRSEVAPIVEPRKPAGDALRSKA